METKSAESRNVNNFNRIVSAEKQSVLDGSNYKIKLEIIVPNKGKNSKLSPMTIHCNVIVFYPINLKIQKGGGHGPVIRHTQLLDCSCCGSSWTRPKPESSTQVVHEVTVKDDPTIANKFIDIDVRDMSLKRVAVFVSAKFTDAKPENSQNFHRIVSAEKQSVPGGSNYKIKLQIIVPNANRYIRILTLGYCDVIAFDPIPRKNLKGIRGPVDPPQLLECSCCGSSWTRPKPESRTTGVVRITTKNPIKLP